MKLSIRCACGCGQELISAKKSTIYIRGHHIIDEGHLTVKCCKKCNQSKEICKFEQITSTHKYNGKEYIKYAHYCDECKKNTLQARLDRTEVSRRETKLKYKERHHTEPKYHIQDKISYWRSKYHAPSNLTVDYLVELFEKQNYRCYYSGEEIFFGLGKGAAAPLSASLDRKIPELGYVQGNVVWCSFFINTMKGNLSELLFLQLINKILDHRQNALNILSFTEKEAQE